MMKRAILALALAALAPVSFAQAPVGQDPSATAPTPEEEAPDAEEDEDDDESPAWNVASPPLPTREVNIDVTQGTWMNIDVSPDGRTIAFDLLGDIYTLPIAGGEATRVAAGLPFEMQPQFSPDGARIAFTSDRGGGDNIWIMNRDGSDVREVTDEDFRLLNQPAWRPDGRYIAARRHFTTERSLGTGEIWLYHLGGGDGVVLVKRANEDLQKELGEPAWSADGRSIFYTRNTTPGNTFQYAQDSNAQVFAIERYDLETGEVFTVVDGAGGAVRPTPSPDGRYLAFVRRVQGQSDLFVKDLRSGQIRRLYGPLDRDLQETWAVHGVYPTMDWMPDSRSIVFWAGGGIRRVDMSGAVSEIPFHVADTRTVIDPPRPQVAVAPETFETRMPRYVAASPDGRSVVFESLGKLYVRSTTGNAAPRRLTSNRSDSFELFPSYSRDGRRIVFVEWTDDGLGRIRTVSAGGGSARDVTREPGHYRRPRFSPDGRTIVYEQGRGGFLLSDRWSQSPGVYRISASGGAPERVTVDGSAPHYGAANDRIFLVRRANDKAQLVSVDLNGEAPRVHATGEMVTQYEVSPDGEYLAFRENYAAFVMPMMPGPQSIDAGATAGAAPVVQASAGGATYLNWSRNGRTLNWSLGPTLYSADTSAILPSMPLPADAPPDAAENRYTAPEAGVDLSISVAADEPNGRIALVGARIITMTGDDGGVIENGVILIEGNRITAIGPTAATTIPAGVRTIDVRGRTIIPGLIDAHAHGSEGDDDIIPQQGWQTIAHLALGVTTVFDPSNSAAEIMAAGEMQRAGLILSPRLYSTGEVVYGARSPGVYANIQSYDDALAHVRRLREQGAHGIKNYNQPRRDQRQQVVAAAIAENMLVVAEGGSLFSMDFTIVADGNSSLEHNFPQAVLYDDVLSFYAQTQVNYSPTMVVTYGGLTGDTYWRSVTNVWEHPILSRYVPPHILRPRSVRRVTAPEGEFQDSQNAAQARALAERGVSVTIGGHGQEEGLASHWEMWSLVRGGMSPLEALRAGTSAPATHLGFGADLGTLEVGKLADLLILTADPLTDIRNTEQIERVMLNGRLYDTATMNEVETGNRQRRPFYWERGNSAP